MDAQARRQEGKLRAAREALLVCGRDACPARLRADCVTWLAEVDAATPTVVLVARDADGRDRTDARATIDGEPAPRIDGRPLPLDPGAHAFRFSAPGAPDVELTAVVRQGERDRPIVASFAAPPRAAAEPTPAPARRPVPAFTFVLGGAGLVAAGVGTFFALSGVFGHPGRNELLECRPHCAQGEVDAVSRKFAAADVASAIAVVALAAAVYVYVTRPAVAPPTRAAR